MQRILELLINYFFSAREFFTNALGPALPWLKFSSLIISGLLLWGIIYAISGSGYLFRKKIEWRDRLGFKSVGRERQLRIWKRIIKYLKSKEMSHWKAAIIEADNIFDEILKMSGYGGANVHDRFKQLPPSAISNYDKILAAHKVRDRVLEEADFIINQKEATDVIQVYQQAFKELGLID